LSNEEERRMSEIVWDILGECKLGMNTFDFYPASDIARTVAEVDTKTVF
jgi:hypothetical protein